MLKVLFKNGMLEQGNVIQIFSSRLILKTVGAGVRSDFPRLNRTYAYLCLVIKTN